MPKMQQGQLCVSGCPLKASSCRRCKFYVSSQTSILLSLHSSGWPVPLTAALFQSIAVTLCPGIPLGQLPTAGASSAHLSCKIGNRLPAGASALLKLDAAS